MIRPEFAHRRRPLVGLFLIAIGALLCLVRARFAFAPTDQGPRLFELGLQFGPTLRIASHELVERLAELHWLRPVWAALASLLGILVARSLARRLALAPGARSVLSLGLAATFFAALDPGLWLFVAERSFSGAPHYLELEDLVRGLGVSALACGALALVGAGPPARDRAPESRQRATRALLAGAGLVAGGVPAAFSGLVLAAPADGVAHQPLTNDGRAYQFQAELFAAGELAVDAGPAAAHFQARQVLREGTRFASKYPPGHSLLLVPGLWLAERAPLVRVLFGERLVPLLLQAALPLVVFALARRAGARRPLLAAWLYALSPTPLMLGALWLSHGTSLPFAALALWIGMRALDARERGGHVDAALCGLALSICALARPGTALAVALPLVVSLALRPAQLVRLAPTATFAALPGLVLFAWINARTTGDPWLPAYVRYAELVSPDDRWGLENFASAPTSLALNGARLGLWLAGFGASAGLAWIGLVVAGCRFRILFAGTPLALAAFYALLTFHGVPWAGPLYWVEAYPLLLVLAAEGLDRLAVVFGRRIEPIALAAAALGSALLIGVRAPLARAEFDLRRAHEAADLEQRRASGEQGPRLVELSFTHPLELKRRFLAPPLGLATGEALPATVFVVEGAPGRLPEALEQRPRWRFDAASGAVVEGQER